MTQPVSSFCSGSERKGALVKLSPPPLGMLGPGYSLAGDVATELHHPSMCFTVL